MVNRNKVLSLLGFSQKAGKAISGAEGLRWHISNKKAHVIIMAEDIEEKDRKAIARLCQEKRVPCVEFLDQDSLGKAIGRSPKKAVAVTDKGMAAAILKLMDRGEIK